MLRLIPGILILVALDTEVLVASTRGGLEDPVPTSLLPPTTVDLPGNVEISSSTPPVVTLSHYGIADQRGKLHKHWKAGNMKHRGKTVRICKSYENDVI